MSRAEDIFQKLIYFGESAGLLWFRHFELIMVPALPSMLSRAFSRLAR